MNTMHLAYPDKQPEPELRRSLSSGRLSRIEGDETALNMLIRGDNLPAMTALRDQGGLRGRVDLVYIDPPFSTNNVFRHDRKRTATISRANQSDVAYVDTLRGHAFIEFLRLRLILLRELMAPHASIFLHIDGKIGHYVKVIMDEVFGPENFRNDITRIKCNPKNFSRKGFGNVKDLILFYTRSDDFVWHEPRVHLTDADVKRLFPKTDARGRRYTTTPLHAPGETRQGLTGKTWRGRHPPAGRHWRYAPAVLDELDSEGLIEWSSNGNPRKIIFADDAELRGKKLQDVWEFKDPLYPDYPTEKNIDMLRTILGACSEPGDLVLDCFCGSGTSLVAAEEMERRWIGIDQSSIAIETAKRRLDARRPELFVDTYAQFSAERTTAQADNLLLNEDAPTS